MDVFIDALSIRTRSGRGSLDFFTEATSHLLAAGGRVRVGHHIALSIVGVDRVPYGYYEGKRAQEQTVQSGTVPWSIQRATQFHDFVAQMYRNAAIGPLRPAVRMRTQPIAVGEVAARLVDFTEAGPAGQSRHIAGPREERLTDMMREWVAHIGRRRWMPEVFLPDAFGRPLRDGSVLPDADADLGTVTFADWLKAQPRG